MHEFVVIGSSGMLGHRVLRSLHEMSQNSAVGIMQTNFDPMLPKNLQFKCSSLENILDVIEQIRPRVVINCAGLIKQSSLNCDNADMINVNTLLPHMLANQGAKVNYRLITISSDCVFDGETGGYVESDVPNAPDIYGKSKALGEIFNDPHLTIRTSIIGHELFRKNSLLEWFLSQKGIVQGYSEAFFSGVTTNEISAIILQLVSYSNFPSGLYHIAGQKISKYDLLQVINEIYECRLMIQSVGEPKIDRSLDSRKAVSEGIYKVKSWREMINTMKEVSQTEARHIDIFNKK